MYLTPDSLFGKRGTHDDASHIERVTDEPYCHARTLTGWRREIVQISPGRFQGRVFEACGRDVRVAREFLSRGVFHIGSAYAGGLTLGLIRSTDKRAAIWNGIQVQPDTVVCVPPGRKWCSDPMTKPASSGFSCRPACWMLRHSLSSTMPKRRSPSPCALMTARWR